jgi:hypothetical protein
MGIDLVHPTAFPGLGWPWLILLALAAAGIFHAYGRKRGLSRRRND